MSTSKFEGTQEEWDALVQKSKMQFKVYKRKGLSEMIAVQDFIANGGDINKVSISSPDHLLQTHDPEEFAQGFVARNPKNHEDLWYVAKKYHDDNLEEVTNVKVETFIDRLLAERDQLSDRLIKLEGFLSNKTKATEISGPTQVAMLIEQYQHMAIYLNILDKRIDNLATRAEKAIEFKLPNSN